MERGEMLQFMKERPTERQIDFLKKYGIDSVGMSRWEARKKIGELIKSDA